MKKKLLLALLSVCMTCLMFNNVSAFSLKNYLTSKKCFAIVIAPNTTNSEMTSYVDENTSAWSPWYDALGQPTNGYRLPKGSQLGWTSSTKVSTTGTFQLV